jgi:D-alanyl-D-alanine carboxypeptidase/D-alanyl-D-alanine-endopeptidase (penicillin-binding protein 4)
VLEPKVWQLTAGSVVVGLVLAAGAVGAAGPWDSGQRRAERERAVAANRTGGADRRTAPDEPAPAPSAPGVLPALSTTVTAPADLGKRLGPLLKDPALGPVRTGVVIDLVTGKRLYGKAADQPMTPASTVKLATMVAALSALGPDHRIATTVVATPDAGKVTLVGGGDATLGPAGLRDLADQTARALRGRGVSRVEVGYDGSLYAGPREHSIGPNENIAPVVALMSDEGRLDASTGGPAPRSGDPAGDAADAFAGLLRARGIRTTGSPAPVKAARNAKDSATVATTYSLPLADLVERALTESDNDIAESLARQTAIAAGEPASFAGGGRAVMNRLRTLELPLTGARFTDGSGLDRKDKVTASLLTALLARAADPAEPQLRPVLTGLPVAGFSGTLQRRFTDDPPATGVIRAKTGTLTGVNTLAGTAVDARGRLLGFAFMAGATQTPDSAQKALDKLSAALVR